MAWIDESADEPRPCRSLEHADLTLPRYSAAEARMARLITDARLAPWARSTFGAQHVGVHTLAAGHLPEGCVWVGLNHRGDALWLGLPTEDHPALLAAASHGEESAAEPLRRAIAQRLLEPLLQVLARIGLQPVEVVGLAGDSAGVPPAMMWRVAVDMGSEKLDVHIAAAAAASWLDVLHDELHRTVAPEATPVALRLPGCLMLGLKRMSIQALQSLRPGDVILRALAAEMSIRSAEPWISTVRWPRAPGPVGHAAIEAAVRVHGTRLTIIEKPCMNIESADDIPEVDAESGDDQEQALPLGEVELPVQIELATAAMPIAQIGALRPGHVMELPCTVRDARIRLTAFGQLIAMAELVTIGDRLGVRITSMAK